MSDKRWFRRSIMTIMTALLAGPLALSAQNASPRARECPDCAEWNATQKPLRLFANVYFVGTHGLTALLVTSPAGHVLIDGGLPESAPKILASIQRLGFRPRDVKLIVNSHEHYDHAGGDGTLQRVTGARVAASPAAAVVMESGTSGRSDPQFGLGLDFPPVRATVQRLRDGDTLRVGPLVLTARFTPGHTPGGTSWTWTSCQAARCIDFVYADSQTPISADGFLFTRNETYPAIVTDFERGHRVLSEVACDVLITPHPSASSLWERVAVAARTGVDALVDRESCRRYAANARAQLAKRLAKERGAP